MIPIPIPLQLAIARRRAQRKTTRPRRRPPVWLPPTAVERRYRALLRDLITQWTTAVREQVLPQLARWEAEILSTRPEVSRLDDWPDQLHALMARLKLSLTPALPRLEITLQSLGEQAATWNASQWQKILRATLGVDVFTSAPWLRAEIHAFAKENALLITSIPEQLITDVEKITLRGLRAGQRHEAIAQELQERFGLTENKAALIARDQIGSLNGKLTELRQTELGVTSYLWRTAADERVRPTHAARDGKEFAWDDPPEDGHPGQPINCRCFAEPLLTPLLEDAA